MVYSVKFVPVSIRNRVEAALTVEADLVTANPSELMPLLGHWSLYDKRIWPATGCPENVEALVFDATGRLIDGDELLTLCGM